jgi:hypothetical protein
VDYCEARKNIIITRNADNPSRSDATTIRTTLNGGPNWTPTLLMRLDGQNDCITELVRLSFPKIPVMSLRALLAMTSPRSTIFQKHWKTKGNQEAYLKTNHPKIVILENAMNAL